jgi:hypothetical protein
MQVLTTAPSPPFPTGTSISPTCPSPSCASLRRWSRPRWASRRRRRRTSLPKVSSGWMDRVRVQLSRQTLGGEGRVPCRIRQVDWQAELGKAHVTGCPQRWQSGAWYRVTASAHVFRQVGRADHADSVSRFTFTADSSGLGGEQQYAEGRGRMGVHSRGRMVLCIHSRLEWPRGVNSSTPRGRRMVVHSRHLRRSGDSISEMLAPHAGAYGKLWWGRVLPDVVWR